MRGVRIAAASGPDRIVVLDSLTQCDGRVTPRDVVVAGSFAGALAFGFALERGVRGLVAHAAGVGRDGAGISGLPLADDLEVPAAAVDTTSARLGDGWSLWSDGVIAHVNRRAAALAVAPGQPAHVAARAMLAAPPGAASPRPLVDRCPRVVAAGDGGRVVLVESMSFAGPEHRGDVLCAGSHGGRVNVERLLSVRPRGALFNDGGGAREASGISGLAALDEVGVAAACVDAMSARIGDPESTYADGVVSAVNQTARRVGVAVGQRAAEAALRMLRGGA
jgi:hypothetical protein